MIDHHRSTVQKLHQHSSTTEYHDCQDELPDDHQQQFESACEDKKSDNETSTPQPQGGYVWRISSGIVSSTAGVLTGAVGLGVGGVKWVASKGMSAGGAVVDTTKHIVGKVPVSALKRKDKKE